MSRGRIVLLLLSFTVTLILISGASFWFIHTRLSQPFQAFSGEAQIFVSQGDTARVIAARLEQGGVISSALWFRCYLRYRGDRYFLQAGEYRFPGPLSPIQVAEKLHRGEVHRYKVTLPEGLSLQEAAARLESAGFGNRDRFLQLAAQPDLISDLDPEAEDLEGYLYPETYYFTFDADEEKILRTLTNAFRVAWTRQRQLRAEELGLTLRQVLTLASLVEKETALAVERPLISAVFHNRLKRKMRLECDPTVIYAVRRIKEFDGIIHQSDLELDSPYNTYRNGGLPPGPIANPGLDSIHAALHPAPVDHLFFVARDDGSHSFSNTYREHRRAVLTYQR